MAKGGKPSAICVSSSSSLFDDHLSKQMQLYVNVLLREI